MEYQDVSLLQKAKPLTRDGINTTQIRDYLRKLANKRSISAIGLGDLCIENRDATVQQVSEIIKKYGVVCILNAVDKPLIERLKLDIESFSRDLQTKIDSSAEASGRIRNGVWQKKNTFASTMQEFCDYPKPIINVRGQSGVDSGMFDMFNIDKMEGLSSNHLTECSKSLSNELISSVVEQNSPYRFSTLQVYRNFSVRNTRRFHIDNLMHTFKSFLYLTDVSSTDDGPYCYVPGSHRIPYIHRLELRVTEKAGANTRDILSSEYMNHVEFIAPAGTLILSDQSGIHRGLPQAQGALRIAMVANFNKHRLQ